MKLIVCKECGYKYNKAEKDECPNCGCKLVFNSLQRSRMTLALQG